MISTGRVASTLGLLVLIAVNAIEATIPISAETLGEIAIPYFILRSGNGFASAGRLAGKTLAGSLHFSQINLKAPPKQFLPDYTLKGPHVKDGLPESMRISPNPTHPSSVLEVPSPQLVPLPGVHPKVLVPGQVLKDLSSPLKVPWLRYLYPFLPYNLH